MIPAEFAYFAPASVKEAADLLGQHPDAKVLGGGMSLIPALKHRLLEPSALVDLARIPDLDGVRVRRGRAVLGGRVTHAQLGASTELAEQPIFAETARVIGDVQVRNRGTLAGSLVHADPAADWPAVFLALDGEVSAVGPRGKRTLSAADFFTGMLQSAVGQDEIVTEVRLSLERGRSGAAYAKLRQQASGFAVVGVAAQVTLDRRGRCERATIGITGVNPVPFRATGLEERLRGAPLGDGVPADLVAEVDEADPMQDIHASAEYRRHLAGIFARRALVLAAARAAA